MKHLAVVIPARDEQRYVAAALRAIDRAARAAAGLRVSVLVWVNDSVDATAQAARVAATHLSVAVHVVETESGAADASAGRARRDAARYAVAGFAPDALLTTDADAILSPATLAAIAAELAAAADLVCGWTTHRLPRGVASAPPLVRLDRVGTAYMDLVHDTRFAIDLLYRAQTDGPRPHYVESGACMALTTSLYHRLGGLPEVDSSEDRALVRAAEAIGARIRYSTGAHARVSARLNGRAPGGMAETLRARVSTPDPVADEMAVPAAALRSSWAFALAQAHGGQRPRLFGAERRLRASELERELPEATAFVAAEIRPWLARREASLDVGRAVA